MASHAGLKYVLKTKKGYVKKDGSYTYKINEALVIDFWQFGFGPSAIDVFKRLGYSDSDIRDYNDISFCTIIPSYDSRLGALEDLYQEMGFTYSEACFKAQRDFIAYHLEDDQNYFTFLKKKEEEVNAYYLHSDSNEEELYEVKSNYGVNYNPEYSYQKYYSKEGPVYKYQIRIKKPDLTKYFKNLNVDLEKYSKWQNEGLIPYLLDLLKNSSYECNLPDNFKVLKAFIDNDYLNIYTNYLNYNCVELLNEGIRSFYEQREMHITRMFGSYILLQRINNQLQAVLATEVPIKYCPLMIKLLNEVGKDQAMSLIKAIEKGDKAHQQELMKQLINEVVIKGGYFATNRPLNSCEVNVLFGASETISSAFKSHLIDAAVIVSNNLGTIITTNDTNTQGAVKRMTGLFYTSPSKELATTAEKENIKLVFPYTAQIDMLAGVKKAIAMGYKRIAVTLAAADNYLLEEIKKLETDDIVIYKFGLCSTGIDEKTAEIMSSNADVIWSCASKYVRELVEPIALAQVGIKIPVHIMSKRGWEIVKNHLAIMNSGVEINPELASGDAKPVILNQDSSLKLLKKKDLRKCEDCPYPCI